jgi:hypothetical protein
MLSMLKKEKTGSFKKKAPKNGVGNLKTKTELQVEKNSLRKKRKA